MYARVLPDRLEACPLRSQDNNFLDFVVNRFLIKLFKTNNLETVSLLIVARGITLTYYSTVLKEKVVLLLVNTCIHYAVTFLCSCAKHSLDSVCFFVLFRCCYSLVILCIYCILKTSPIFLAVTRESIVGFSQCLAHVLTRK